MRIKIKIDKSVLKDYINNDLKYKLDDALNDIADFIATESDRLITENSTDTGFLKNSMVTDKKVFLYKEVGSNSLYAPYIEYGTSPHRPPIKPIYDWCWRKRVDLGIKVTKGDVTLRDGNIYNRSVLNVAMAIIKTIEKKGTSEKPFLRPSFNLAKQRAGDLIKKSMSK